MATIFLYFARLRLLLSVFLLTLRFPLPHFSALSADEAELFKILPSGHLTPIFAQYGVQYR